VLAVGGKGESAWMGATRASPRIVRTPTSP
jgi:hypothetical protein